MRTSQQIQEEYDQLKQPKQGGLHNNPQQIPKIDPKTDAAYQEAIKRAKLEEQAKDQREQEANVEAILNGTNTIINE